MPSGLIIFAEDDPSLRKLYRDRLRMEGYLVIEAEDGHEALMLLSAHVPKLLLLDVRMPRLDGIETCRRARSIMGDRVPIMFLTVMDDLETLHDCVTAGADDYVVKQAGPEVVVQRVNRWISRPRRHSAEARRRETLNAVQQTLDAHLAALAGAAGEATEANRGHGLGPLLSSETSRVLAELSRLLRQAQEAAGDGFGRTVEHKLCLLGYAAGLVDQMGRGDLDLRFRFNEYVRAVLEESEVLDGSEIDEVAACWSLLAEHQTFLSAFENGRRDLTASQRLGRGHVPGGLATALH